MTKDRREDFTVAEWLAEYRANTETYKPEVLHQLMIGGIENERAAAAIVLAEDHPEQIAPVIAKTEATDAIAEWDPSQYPDAVLREIRSIGVHPLARRMAAEELEARLPRVVPAHDGSGEAVDLADLDDAGVVGYVDLGDQLIARVKDHQTAARAELRRRADRRLKWSGTVLLDDGREAAWKVPGPDAGSVTYDVEQALEVVRRLVGAGVIDEEPAAAAVVRKITLTFDVPLYADLPELSKAIANGSRSYTLHGVALTLGDVARTETVHMPAVRKLSKVKAAKAAFAAIEKPQYPARRTSVSADPVTD